MIAEGLSRGKRESTRRELLRRYLQLQRELIEADPASSAYPAIVHAFRQLGHALISAGLEGDLDRLLRIRVIEGGRGAPTDREHRQMPADLLVLETRPVRMSEGS